MFGDKSKLRIPYTLLSYEDMELHQVFWVFLALVVTPLGLIIGKKLYHNVKQEEHLEKGKVLQRVIKTYVVVQCIAWPLILCLIFIVGVVAKTTQLSPALEFGLRAVISITRFLYILTLNYVGFNSLIIAICRYIFIVIVKHSDTFTIKRIRRWALASSVIVPILMAMLHEATIPVHYRWAERVEQMMMPENDKIDTMKSHVNTNTTIKLHQSPIFILYDEYVPFAIKFILGIASTAMKLVVFSNILEGCLYAHIYIQNRRSENAVDASLSEEVKVKRHRQKTINLQMTLISWSLEFVTCLVGMLQLVNHIRLANQFLHLALLSIVLNFVIIPSTYLLHTEICKTFVIAQGWWKSFRTLFSSNRVAPAQNENKEGDRNPNARSNFYVSTFKNTEGGSNRNPNAKSNFILFTLKNTERGSNRNLNVKSQSIALPQRIPTVSGNVDASERKDFRVLRNNYI